MNLLAKLPHDKALHLIGGVLLFAAGNFVSPYLGLGLAVGVGLAKELWDWYSKKGTPDGHPDCHYRHGSDCGEHHDQQTLFLLRWRLARCGAVIATST